MKTILVSLVSDQTIPNILNIHHFRPDELLFVTTEVMEKKQKTASIMATLRLLGLEYAETCVQKTVVKKKWA